MPKMAKKPSKKPAPAKKARPARVSTKKYRHNEITLSPDEMPTKWYNIIPDLPVPMPPPMDPKTGYSRLATLPRLFIGECLKQEMNTDTRWIDIPEGVRELFLQAGRPRPLFRAKRLEEELGTPAQLYYKSEFYSPTGSHKVNTALAQVYYAQKEGVQRLTTETGAGQWGTALAYATALVKIPLTVYWVRAVYNWKADRKALMKMYGAEVFASPSNNTKCGKALCDKDPNDPGSLGIAVSEGIEDALTHDNSRYALGSVLTHVLLHQTIIGLETKLQLQKVGVEYPDMMISCLGGGSNFGGFTLPLLGDRCRKRCETQFLAAQSEVAHNLTGEYKYDYGDHAEQTPLMKMTTLGHQTRMDPIRGDGLRYHAAAPLLSCLRNQGLIDSVAYPKDEKHVFDCAELFVKTEGFLPAPESAYSVTAAIDEARKCKKTGEKKVIAFNISGHGFLDMVGYIEKLGIK